jgi:hypothetical protein
MDFIRDEIDKISLALTSLASNVEADAAALSLFINRMNSFNVYMG